MMIQGGGAVQVGVVGGSQAPLGLQTRVDGPRRVYPSSQLNTTEALIRKPSTLNSLPLAGLERGLHCVAGALVVVVVVVVVVVDDDDDDGVFVAEHTGGSGFQLPNGRHLDDVLLPSSQARMTVVSYG